MFLLCYRLKNGIRKVVVEGVVLEKRAPRSGNMYGKTEIRAKGTLL